MNKRIRKAFTLTELVIVIAVVTILAAVLIPTFSNVVERSKQTAALEVCTNAIKSYQNEVLLDGNPDNDDITGLVVSNKDYYYIQLNNKLNFIGKLGANANIVKLENSRDITEKLQSIGGLELGGGVTAFSMPLADDFNALKLTIGDKEIFIDLSTLGIKALYFYNVEVDGVKYVGYFVINANDKRPTHQGANISTQQAAVSYNEDKPIKVEEHAPVDQDQLAVEKAVQAIDFNVTTMETESLSLPAAVESNGKIFTISWTSSREDVIKASVSPAAVNRQDTDVDVTLTAKITLNGKSATRDFTVKVLAKQYTINVTENEHAQVVDLSVQQGTVGTAFTFKVTADEHYQVVKVLVNGKEVTAVDGVYSSEITGEMTITVETKPVEYTVSVAETSSADATVSGLPEIATFGQKITFTVTANEHYIVKQVLVNDKVLTGDNGTYTLTVEGNTEIKVETEDKQYSVTLGEHANATVGGLPTTAIFGQEVTFTVTANEHYVVKQVLANSEVLTGDNGIYTFKVNGNTEITVETEDKQYSVTLGEHANATVDGLPQTATFGKEITFTVTADEHYIVKQVLANGTELTASGDSYTLTVNGDTEITVVTEDKQYSLTLGEHANATVGGLPTTAIFGQEVTFTVTANEHYVVKQVLANGTKLTATGDSYTFKVNGNTEITVETEDKQYSVTLGEHANATVSELPETAIFGQEITFTVTANEHYDVKQVLVNGKVLTGDNGTYTFTVEGNTEIKVETEDKQYSVTLAGDYSAAATIEGLPETAIYNGVVTFTVNANTGYEIVSVKANDEVLPSDNGNYTFTVQGDTTITVETSSHWASEQNPVEMGDEVIIGYINGDKLTGFAGFTGENKFGDATDVDLGNVEEKFVVAVVKGYEDGTVAFITSMGKYLKYEGTSNALYTSVDLNANSSWTLTYNSDNTVSIQNCAVTERYLQYNVKDPRFACYTTTQGQISLYILDRTDEEKVNSVANSIVLDSEYSADFTLPTDPRATIEWTVSGGTGIEIVDGQAIVTKTNEQQTVTLKATITLNGASVDKTFTITIPAKAQYQVTFQLTGATVDKENSLVVSEGEEFTFTITPETNFKLVSVTVTMGNGQPQQLLPADNDGTQPFTATITITADTTIEVIAQDTTIPQPEEKSVVLTVDNLNLGAYRDEVAGINIDGILVTFKNLGSFGSGIQMNKSNANLTVTSIGIGIKEIKVDLNKTSTLEFNFEYEKVDAGNNIFTIIPKQSNITSFVLTNSGTAYIDSITITYFEKQLTDAEKVAADKESLALETSYTEDFELPASGEHGTTITWAVTEGTAITIDGTTAKVTRGDADQTVKLTATITLNEETTTKEFTITVPKQQSGGEVTVGIAKTLDDLDGVTKIKIVYTSNPLTDSTSQYKALGNNTGKYSASVSFGEGLELTLVKNSDGTYSFKCDDTNYLEYHGGSNELYCQDKGNINWTIEIADGVAKIENAATAGRYLQYNASATRFACYKTSSNQKDVSIYIVG